MYIKLMKRVSHRSMRSGCPRTTKLPPLAQKTLGQYSLFSIALTTPKAKKLDIKTL